MGDAYQYLSAVVLVAIYGYVVYTDFSQLRIANGAALALAVVAGSASAIQGLVHFGADLLVAVVLFAVTFPFWLLGAIGAGDVKLIAVSGLAVGLADVFVFAALILLFSVILLALISYSRGLLFLPLAVSRRLVTFLDEKRIPYGVPIALAAIATVVLRATSMA